MMRTETLQHRPWICCSGWLLGCLTLLVGCEKHDDPVRDIQQRRQAQQRAAHEIDNLREAHRLVSQLAELNQEAAEQRIVSFLNTWSDSHPATGNWSPTALTASIEPRLKDAPGLRALDASRFVPSDVEYLELNYLLRQVTKWAGQATGDDPLFAEWLSSLEERLGSEGQFRLRQASQLFDWTIRNIALEPLELDSPAPPIARLPAGLTFRGPGYRQTTLETLMRSSGDPWQRARVFIQLCRQAGIDACLLGLPGENASEPSEWLVGVRVGEELFLFEPRLGIPVPGPDQVGIATLGEAREDASILRRLNVPGWFDYPIDAEMVQQTVALLDAPPESLSQRMARLEAGLTGETRMMLGYDATASSEAFKAIPGITAVQLWSVPFEAQIYEAALAEAAENDLNIAAWQASEWGMLTPGFPLAKARWEHLVGDFDSEGQEEGARILYMQLRHPEFDIDDLEFNVDLQRSYGIRRQLGQSNEEFSFQIRRIQEVMRVAKRAASYWLSLIHYDTGDYENARNWFDKRVLGDEQRSRWEAAARYNLARSLEHLGDLERAEELYKTIDAPQEHGNRIRARLLSRQE